MKSTLFGHRAASAPTADAAETRDSRSTIGTRAFRVTAIAAALAIVVAGTILGQTGQSAFAADYPTWADVQAARSSVKAKEAQIAQLNALLTGLQAQVDSTQAIAQQKGAEWQAAQQKYDESSFKADELQKQADVAQAKAAKSKQQAGQLAARLARAGGSDLSARLFFNGGESKSLLSQLGLASMVKDQSAGLYDKATQDGNSAQALTDQANVAKDALKVLAATAQKALEEANIASEKAATALSEQEANKGRLEAQRDILATNSTTTEAGYNEGVEYRAEEAKKLKAAQEAAAAKAAADWAAAHPPSSGGSGGGGSSASPSGWVRPSAGRVTSPFGWRINPVSHKEALHSGTDLGASCNSPIFAAHSGTITFAGPNGGYGNFILMNNGDGVSTGYGHIVNGGFLVRAGQQVQAGQQIAKVGSTGNSTGCHLHFEVRPGGVAIDAAPFMAARGVSF
ncbi:peptidoglycan DD-metalloendopeptidase family protein [Glaciihabitans sp. INWT7]|uniref:M23 family metallopeptidase n=1 Tax=Glaciihabitans sp. INWT7 TaxID=2596912 RepID=UPI00162A852B|nr:M23 family metallopeptidase [Glaciihabitans sp. INWT7]QNE48040.1 peptidoglycan DD-metalloendopeptidase family protein [Glaciihabitans sp. INWT7]